MLEVCVGRQNFGGNRSKDIGPESRGPIGSSGKTGEFHARLFRVDRTIIFHGYAHHVAKEARQRGAHDLAELILYTQPEARDK